MLSAVEARKPCILKSFTTRVLGNGVHEPNYWGFGGRTGLGRWKCFCHLLVLIVQCVGVHVHVSVCVLLQEVFSVWDCLALESYVTRQSAVVEVMYLLYSTFIGGTFIEGFSAFCQFKINDKGYHILSV